MANTDFTPTDEQVHALGLFLSGEHLAVEAGAGTGKTSTLVLMAEAAAGRRGQYVAFNKAIVLDSQEKLPRGASASTAHSLAARATRSGPNGQAIMGRLDTPRQPPAKVAARLRLEPLKITVGQTASFLSPSYLASVTMKAIESFCNSDAKRPSVEHVAYIEGIDMPDAAGRRTYRNNDLVREAVRYALQIAWDDIASPTGSLRFTHSHYLKLWELSGPRISADYIMFDEAQDASPVMLSIVRQQEQHGAQLIYVGDTQQQIYGWRGAINALASVSGERAYLTQSFRFGPAIAHEANVILEKLAAPLRIVGFDQLDSQVCSVPEPRATLCRGNAEAVGRVLTAQAAGRRPYLVGEGIEVVKFARAVESLRNEGWTSHQELNCFSSWGQVQDYVEQDPQGSDLALLVKLVEKFGTDTIIAALSNPVPEDRCTEVISTAHKAKGREWTSVTLATDFPEPDESGLADEEWRLLYVSVTRAQHALDISGVPALDRTPPAPSRVEIPDDQEIAELAETGSVTRCTHNVLPGSCPSCLLAERQGHDVEESGLGFRRPTLG